MFFATLPRHFFADHADVDDKAIMEVLKTTFDYEHPREFCWALMDYGAFLKQTAGNLSRLSRHYAKQSKFEGSLRQIRGRVLKTLTNGGQTLENLQAEIEDERLDSVLSALQKEGLVVHKNDHYRLP